MRDTQKKRGLSTGTSADEQQQQLRAEAESVSYVYARVCDLMYSCV